MQAPVGHRRLQRNREEPVTMSISHVLALNPSGLHDTRAEGARLGLIMATSTWIWIAAVDVVAGQPFHTFAALGGIAIFTIVHYLLNITYGTVLLSVIHSAARAPSVMFGLIFGLLIFEGSIAMLSGVLAEMGLGNTAWIAILGGSLISTLIAFALVAYTHPLAKYLRQAEQED
jgi:hypothetical protein